MFDAFWKLGGSLVAILAVGLLTEKVIGQTQEDLSDETRRLISDYRKENGEALEQMRLLREFIGISNNQSLLSELDIVSDQAGALARVLRDYQREQQALMRSQMPEIQEVQDLVREERLVEVVIRNMELEKAQLNLVSRRMREVEEILLPHQIRRVKQLAIQRQLRVESNFQGLLGVPLGLAEQLGITPEEKQKLESMTNEANKEFEEQMEKLHEKLLKRLIDSLPKEKQDEVEEIIGKLYPVRPLRWEK